MLAIRISKKQPRTTPNTKLSPQGGLVGGSLKRYAILCGVHAYSRRKSRIQQRGPRYGRTPTRSQAIENNELEEVTCFLTTTGDSLFLFHADAVIAPYPCLTGEREKPFKSTALFVALRGTPTHTHRQAHTRMYADTG